MTLEEVAENICSHGYDARVEDERICIYHDEQLLDALSVIDCLDDGDSWTLESSVDQIVYGVDMTRGTMRMDQLLEILEDRRGWAESELIVVEVKMFDVE